MLLCDEVKLIKMKRVMGANAPMGPPHPASLPFAWLGFSAYSYHFQNPMVIESSLFMPPTMVFSAQEGNAGIEIKRSMGLLITQLCELLVKWTHSPQLLMRLLPRTPV